MQVIGSSPVGGSKEESMPSAQAHLSQSVHICGELVEYLTEHDADIKLILMALALEAELNEAVSELTPE